MLIQFREVRFGEKFTTPNHKRLLGGVKIAPTTVPYRGQTIEANAVILTDHVGEPAQDAGVLFTVKQKGIVAVER
jgi:hypothetical protein